MSWYLVKRRGNFTFYLYFCDLYCPRMSWAEHVARMGEMKHSYKMLVHKPPGKHLGNIGIDGKVLLKWILKK
jgi:hypothetical protein